MPFLSTVQVNPWQMEQDPEEAKRQLLERKKQEEVAIKERRALVRRVWSSDLGQCHPGGFCLRFGPRV